MRRGAAALLGLACASFIGVQGVAAVGLWTLSMSPTTAVVGVSTTFSFTATSQDPDLAIKCVTVDVPAAVSPGETWVTGSSTTAAWVSTRDGQRVTVAIASGDGNQKLLAGGWVSFAVTGVPTQAGTYALPGVAYSNHGCSENARALAAPPSLVVTGPADPEPTPTPTPRLTPSPLPTPTASPTPRPSATPKPSPTPTSATTPKPTPTLQPTPTPTPELAGPSRGDRPSTRPTATPGASATPTASASETPSPAGASPSPSDSAAAPPPRSAGAPRAEDPAAAVLVIARADQAGPDAVQVSLGPLGAIEGVAIWAIPSAVIGGPGLLVLIWVGAQAIVAAAWTPAVKRLQGRATPWSGKAVSAS